MKLLCRSSGGKTLTKVHVFDTNADPKMRRSAVRALFLNIFNPLFDPGTGDGRRWGVPEISTSVIPRLYLVYIVYQTVPFRMTVSYIEITDLLFYIYCIVMEVE